jgi:hypothetical protein
LVSPVEIERREQLREIDVPLDPHGQGHRALTATAYAGAHLPATKETQQSTRAATP